MTIKAAVNTILLSLSTFCLAAEPSIEFQKLDDDAAGAGYVVVLKDMPNEALYVTCKQINSIHAASHFVLADLSSQEASDSSEQVIAPSNCGLLGERIDYRVYTRNWQLVAENTYVPRQIASNSLSETFTLSAELLSIFPTIYKIHLDGAEERELIKLVYKTAEGEVKREMSLNSEGDFLINFMNRGLTQGGKEGVVILRRNGDFATVSLNWGTEISFENAENKQERPKKPLKVVTLSLQPGNTEKNVSKIQFQGLPPGKNYSLFAASFITGNRYKKIAAFDLLPNGTYQINGYQADALGIKGIQTVPGEPVFFMLQNSEHVILAADHLIPRPFLATSKKGTFSVEAIFLGLNPTTYQLKLKGLDLDEEYHFASLSGDERIDRYVPFHENDFFSYNPGTVTAAGGSAQAIFTRRNGDLLTMEIPWGQKIRDDLKSSQRSASSKP